MSAAAVTVEHNEALAAMLRGATVLTPNVRSSRGLARMYDNQRRSEGLTSWQPARIVSWNGWATSLWNDAILHGHVSSVLLNSLQEHALWISVIEASGDLGLQSARSVARQCSHALKLLGAYDLEDRFARTPAHELSDAAAFHGWYRDFIASCQGQSLLPGSHLDAELNSLFRRKILLPDSEYILYGFDTLQPSQRAVIEALEHVAEVKHVPAHVPPQSHPALVPCNDLHAEVDACGQWVRDTLIAQPDAHIAIVVPDLGEFRPVLERTLRAIVAPWLEDVTQQHYSVPYEFSVGRPLAQVDMVSDAMRLLRWCVSPLSVDDVGAMLRSHCLSVAPTSERGAELEAWTLRNLRRFRFVAGLSGKISLHEAERLFYKEDSETSTKLRELAKTEPQGSQGYAAWSDHARKLLDIAGWAKHDLNSTEFQVQQRWNEAIDRVATLDLLGSHITFGDWLAVLEVALKDIIFAPENMGASVQVMTPSEAAGSVSTHLWFLHASEQTWPQHSSPSPLLPVGLQRALAMPGSDALLDEASARQVTLRCVSSTAHARFSYATTLAEGESRPSPLVKSLPNLEQQAASAIETVSVIPLEEVADTLPLPHLTGTAAGGVGILTEQAQCGFRAFASHRLLTREMESVDAGLSAGERGDEVHTALQEFWTNCRTQEQLIALTRAYQPDGSTARDALLAACIEKALPETPAAGWDTAYIAVQRKRLHRILSDWLDFELLRTPFHVDGMEVPVPEAHIGPLHMNIRVDRIDSIPLADGTHATLLIDYKTGAAERKDWFGDRPDAPQLPLYAIAGGIANVQGITFGRVRVGKFGMNFEEMVANRSLIGDKASKNRRSEPSFEERLEEWQRDLTALAEAFARGEAVVEPKDYLTTCKRCASRLLCRVDVTRLEPDDDLLDEAEDEGFT